MSATSRVQRRAFKCMGPGRKSDADDFHSPCRAERRQQETDVTETRPETITAPPARRDAGPNTGSEKNSPLPPPTRIALGTLRGTRGHGMGREQPRSCTASRCLHGTRLMGDNHTRATSRPAATSRTGSSARPPPYPGLRDELDAILRDDYRAGRAKPGTDTQAGDRAKPGDAGSGAGKANRTKPDTAARQQRSQGRQSRAGRQGAETEAESDRRRRCSNASRPGSTRTSPNRRTTCHPPNRDRTPRKGR